MACGTLWWPVVPCGGLWYPVVACGTLWWPVVACGGLWYPVVACGTLWWPVVPCGGLWYPVVSKYTPGEESCKLVLVPNILLNWLAMAMGGDNIKGHHLQLSIKDIVTGLIELLTMHI